MLCNNCHKKQAVHCIRTGEKEVLLCADCYESLHGAGEHLLGTDLFSAFFGEEIANDGGRCSACGTTLADYSKNGVVGCEKCYDTFRKDLLPAVLKIHGKTKHTGKRPSEESAYYELLEEQKKLRVMLEQAVKEKRMKDADRINKDIRAINRMIYRGNFGGTNDQ